MTPRLPNGQQPIQRTPQPLIGPDGQPWIAPKIFVHPTPSRPKPDPVANAVGSVIVYGIMLLLV